MDNKEDIFSNSMKEIKILFATKDPIATFWETTFEYFILSPTAPDEVILRTGRIECGKPKIITPDTFLDIFPGFSKDDIDFVRNFSSSDMQRLKALGYQFKHTLIKSEELKTPLQDIYQNIKKKAEATRTKIVILMAPNSIWSMALIKCSFDIIFRSVSANITDLEEKGYFKSQGEKLEQEIEFMFMDIKDSANKKEAIKELGKKLTNMGVFEKYEDRILNLYKESNS